MEDYKPNSYLSKGQAPQEEKKVVQKVINSKVKRKEHNKLADIFVQEDIHNVGEYLFFDVMVPAAKKMVADVFHYGINMWLFGRTGDYDSSKVPASKITYSPYHKYYDDHDRRDPREREKRRYGFDDIYFSSYGEADVVLGRMFEILDHYQVVSVADYYELAGETGTHTDNKWGWTSLEGAEVLHTSGGNYKIRLPRVMPID